MAAMLQPWTRGPCDACGAEFCMTRTNRRFRKATELCGECSVHAARDHEQRVLTRYASILKAQRDAAKRESEILARHSVRADIHHAKCVQLDDAVARAEKAEAAIARVEAAVDARMNNIVKCRACFDKAETELGDGVRKAIKDDQ